MGGDKHTKPMEIGDKHKTSKGNTYTVVDREFKGKNGKDVYYHVRCDVCIKDTALYPQTFQILKSNLKKGSLPCGCSSQYKWSKEQYLLLVERKCKDVRMNYIGYALWETYRTKIQLQCKQHPEETIPSTIERFLMGNCHCKECYKVFNRSRNDTLHLDDFFATGNFPKGTTFSRDLSIKDSNGLYNNWNVKCLKCSEDEIARGGLCNGVFTAIGQALKRGNLPCRCSPSYKWKRAERELIISNILSSEGGKWLSWSPSEDLKERGGNKSKFLWECPNGHIWETGVGKFLHKGTRCGDCLEGDGQYYKLKADHQDICYLILLTGEGESFIKVGRSFVTSFKDRLRTLSAKYKVEVLAINQQKHSIIRPEERNFHQHLQKYHYIPEKVFGGHLKECFTLDGLDYILYENNIQLTGDFNEQYGVPNFRRSG